MVLQYVHIDGMALINVCKDPTPGEVMLKGNKLVFGHRLPRNRKSLLQVTYAVVKGKSGTLFSKMVNLWRHKEQDLMLYGNDKEIKLFPSI